MRKLMRNSVLAVLFCTVAATAAARDEFYTHGLFHADWTAFQFILMPDIQLFDSKTNVYGLSLGLTANIGRNEMRGWSIAPFQARMGNSRGLEMSVVSVSALCDGALSMAFLNIAEPYRGQTPVQFGLVNVSNHGWQFGLFNYNRKSWIPFLPLFNYGPTPAPLEEEEETSTEKDDVK